MKNMGLCMNMSYEMIGQNIFKSKLYFDPFFALLKKILALRRWQYSLLVNTLYLQFSIQPWWLGGRALAS